METSEKVSFHQTAFVCIHVFENVKPVLVVSREAGDWCFSCHATHPDIEAGYKAVGMGHVLAHYPDLNAVLDLLPGQVAARTAVGTPWVRTNFIQYKR